MAHLQMLYCEWLDQDLVGRIQNKSPPKIFSLASLGFGENLSQLFFVNIPSIILRPGKYNIGTVLCYNFEICLKQFLCFSLSHGKTSPKLICYLFKLICVKNKKKYIRGQLLPRNWVGPVQVFCPMINGMLRHSLATLEGV